MDRAQIQQQKQPKVALLSWFNNWAAELLCMQDS